MPSPGQRRDPRHEHPGEQEGEAVGGAAVVLEQDPGEEPVDHASQQPVDAGPVQRRTPIESARRSSTSTSSRRVAVAAVAPPSVRARRPPGAVVLSPEGGRDECGVAKRVAEHVQAGLGACGDPGPERLEAEGVDVDPAAYGWVGGVEQLEAAVDEEPVDAVGADAAADPVRRLEDHHVATGG